MAAARGCQILPFDPRGLHMIGASWQGDVGPRKEQELSMCPCHLLLLKKSVEGLQKGAMWR